MVSESSPPSSPSVRRNSQRTTPTPRPAQSKTITRRLAELCSTAFTKPPDEYDQAVCWTACKSRINKPPQIPAQTPVKTTTSQNRTEKPAFAMLV